MDKKTAKDFAAALADPLTSADKVPAGWYTVAEIAEHTGKSYSHTTKSLCDKWRAGKIERRRFRILTPRCILPVNHFRIIPK